MTFYVRTWLNTAALWLALLRARGLLYEAVIWSLSWLILPALAVGFVIYHAIRALTRLGDVG